MLPWACTHGPYDMVYDSNARGPPSRKRENCTVSLHMQPSMHGLLMFYPPTAAANWHQLIANSACSRHKKKPALRRS